MTQIEIFQAALDKWGKELQLVMACEETAELQKEVCKILRGDNSQERMIRLSEEVADVELMCEQLKHIYRIHGRVEDFRLLKLKRLEIMLKEGH